MKFTWKYPDVSGLYLDGIAVFPEKQGKGQQWATNPNLMDTGKLDCMIVLVLPVLSVLLQAPGHLQLDLLAVFDVTFEGLIDQQSVNEDSTRPSFFEHAS